MEVQDGKGCRPVAYRDKASEKEVNQASNHLKEGVRASRVKKEKSSGAGKVA